MTRVVRKLYSRCVALLLTAAFLGACSLVPPPPVKLPPRSGITPGETITVIGNENIYGIAKHYNVSMRELIVLNNIRAPFTLRAGQKLTLPADKLGSGDEYTPPSYASSSSSSYSSASSAPTPLAASQGTVEQTELAPIEPAPVSQAPLPPPSSSSQIETAPAPHTLSSPVTALNAPSPPPKPVTTTVEQSTPHAASSVASASVNFTWPVQGPMISGYGPKGQGLSNDGVNIGAPKGAPVVAAANGIVVYSGNEMKGFGNLILIRHQGGWVTAYAHLDRALVSKDAVVAQGDMIGTVGKTGNVSSPQLHFETRLNGKPVDPAGVIKGQ